MKEQQKDSSITKTEVPLPNDFIDVSQKRNIWKKAAEKHKGAFVISNTVDNVAEIIKLQVPYKNSIIRISEPDAQSLKIETHWQSVQHFIFSISWEDTIEKFFKFFGKQDIIIGEDEFDDKFLIQSNNADLLKEVLSETQIKRLIIKHNIYSMVSSYHKKTDSMNILTVVNRTSDCFETLSELIGLQKKLIDKLEELELVNNAYE